jgi:hypothetical protein
MEAHHFVFFFGGEKSYPFVGRACPRLPLLSGMAHSECGISRFPGKFLLAPPGPLEPQFQQALATGGLVYELAILLGPQGTKGIREQGPSCQSMILGLALFPHFHLLLTLRTFGAQWNHHFKVKMN